MFRCQMSVVFFFILVSELKEIIQLANLNLPYFTTSSPAPPKDFCSLDQLLGGGGREKNWSYDKTGKRKQSERLNSAT